MIETKIDHLVSYLQKKRTVGSDALSRHVQIPPQTVELICAILEKGGILDINYSLNIAEKPTMTFRLLPAEPPPPEEDAAKGKPIASYTFMADDVPTSVVVSDNEKEKFYTLSLVEFGTATKIFLDLIKDELLRSMPVNVQSDVSDIEKAAKVRED